jgi:hypothetical protein
MRTLKFIAAMIALAIATFGAADLVFWLLTK